MRGCQRLPGRRRGAGGQPGAVRKIVTRRHSAAGQHHAERVCGRESALKTDAGVLGFCPDYRLPGMMTCLMKKA